MKVNLRTGMKTVRHVPPPQVDVSGDQLPLIKPEDPDHKQIQEIWTAQVRVFRLKKDEDVQQLQQVWQMVCNNQARVSETNTQWSSKDDNFVVMMRWADLSYVAPAAT
jgi:hypothetical protein